MCGVCDVLVKPLGDLTFLWYFEEDWCWLSVVRCIEIELQLVRK